MEVAGELQLVKDPESRRANLNYLARYIEDALSNRPIYSDTSCSGRCRKCLARCCCLWFGRRYGNYLVSLYLIVKICYIVNVFGQFLLMNRYLGTNYTFYGFDLLYDLTQGRMWQESGNFPRITLCDFEIRRLANTHRHTVQCVLSINMFNEKIYIFLWFWMTLVGCLTVTSFFLWLLKCSVPTSRTRFIRKYLKLKNLLNIGDRRKSLAFVNSFLRQDGVFIIRLIAQNSGELAAAELVERLWCIFRQKPIGLLASPTRSSAPLPGGGGGGGGTQSNPDKIDSVNNACSPPDGVPSLKKLTGNYSSSTGFSHLNPNQNQQVRRYEANTKRRFGPTLDASETTCMTTRHNQTRNCASAEDDPGEFV